jgi:hypothetical protein
MEAIRHLAMTPIFYLTILPGIAMGAFMIIYPIRTLLGIKNWTSTEAEGAIAHRGRDVRLMTIAQVSLNMVLGAFLLLHWPSVGTEGLLPVLYGIGGTDLLFLYIIVYYVAIVLLARKRLKVFRTDGSVADPEQPRRGEDER